VSSTPVAVPDDLFAGVREHFGDAQIVELTHVGESAGPPEKL